MERFGYDCFETILKKKGVEIIVVTNDKLSPRQELVEDLACIIDLLSCRVHGRRKYKNQIKKDEEVEKIL